MRDNKHCHFSRTAIWWLSLNAVYHICFLVNSCNYIKRDRLVYIVLQFDQRYLSIFKKRTENTRYTMISLVSDICKKLKVVDALPNLHDEYCVLFRKTKPRKYCFYMQLFFKKPLERTLYCHHNF